MASKQGEELEIPSSLDDGDDRQGTSPPSTPRPGTPDDDESSAETSTAPTSRLLGINTFREEREADEAAEMLAVPEQSVLETQTEAEQFQVSHTTTKTRKLKAGATRFRTNGSPTSLDFTCRGLAALTNGYSIHVFLVEKRVG